MNTDTYVYYYLYIMGEAKKTLLVFPIEVNPKLSN